MKQDTKNTFAAILAAAQAKANQQATPKFLQEKPASQPPAKPQPPTPAPAAPDPTPAPKPQADQMPELSALTFADLMPETNAQFCTPVTFTAPTPAAIQPEQPAATQKPAPAPLQIINYSEFSFAVVTPEKPAEEILQVLRSCGGKYNAFLKCGKGWIFSKKRLQQVKDALKIAA